MLVSDAKDLRTELCLHDAIRKPPALLDWLLLLMPQMQHQNPRNIGSCTSFSHRPVAHSYRHARRFAPVLTGGSASPAGSLPTALKRGLSMICQMLHGAADAAAPQESSNAAPSAPAPPASQTDPFVAQAAHNKNGHAFIKVVGCGGGGGNAIARMISTGLQVGRFLLRVAQQTALRVGVHWGPSLALRLQCTVLHAHAYAVD